MVDCEFGGEIRVLQIFVELGKDASLNHTLVNNGSGRERSNVNLTIIVIPYKVGLLHSNIESTTDEVKSTLESITALVIVVKALRSLDKELPHGRNNCLGHGSKSLIIYRNLAPSNETKFISFTYRLHDIHDCLTTLLVAGKEDETNSRLGALIRTVFIKKLPWDLSHDSCSISRNVISSTGSTVLHAVKSSKCLSEYLVGSKFVST
mmetsp:Transcript_4440/g.6814  ORF Transcript_4440/g.6814 Transcript_4440/m.6814 type:complete len:207 (-) Transcript_4440:495-1115(-)